MDSINKKVLSYFYTIQILTFKDYLEVIFMALTDDMLQDRGRRNLLIFIKNNDIIFI